MQLPRLFATGLWLAATVGSTAMVWAATSIVAADVTDRPAPVVAQKDVESELEAGPAPPTAPSSTVPRPAGPSPTLPPAGRGPAPAAPGGSSPVTTAARIPQAGVTVAPAPPPTTAPGGGTPPTTRPAGPTTTQPAPRPTATYSTSGGVVRVACNGFFIELLSAIPVNGYAVKVVEAGPGKVDVRFVRSSQELSVKAVCFGEPIRYYEQSPPREGQRTP